MGWSPLVSGPSQFGCTCVQTPWSWLAKKKTKTKKEHLDFIHLCPSWPVVSCVLRSWEPEWVTLRRRRTRRRRRRRRRALTEVKLDEARESGGNCWKGEQGFFLWILPSPHRSGIVLVPQSPLKRSSAAAAAAASPLLFFFLFSWEKAEGCRIAAQYFAASFPWVLQLLLLLFFFFSLAPLIIPVSATPAHLPVGVHSSSHAQSC